MSESASSLSYSSPDPLPGQARALLLGLALGDALGVPVEFEDRQTRRQDPVLGMRGYGTFHQPPGTWSDDASLTFCLAEAMAEDFTLQRLGENCLRWRHEAWWTAHHEVFDVGITTGHALQRLAAGTPPHLAGPAGEQDNGNGALMRILPLVLMLEGGAEHEVAEFALVRAVAGLTHGHIRSTAACWLYLQMAYWLRHGRTPAEAYVRLCREGAGQLRRLGVPDAEVALFAPLLAGDLADRPESLINSGGYVLHTLEAALWCLLRYDTYAATVLAAVNLGADTDTTAAVAGGLAGLHYGEAGLPPEWLAVLARRADIEALAARVSCLEAQTVNIWLPRDLPRPTPATRTGP
jgi:ADP-ribosyl-[dinitrogen reductase] hydrolase